MTSMLWTVAVIFLAPADTPSRSGSQPKANPFAPSLPYLTPKEEARLDQIIDRFILFDTGSLKGEEGKKAQADFKQLGPEAIPALIRGMNQAAKIEHSCPAVTIARKLAAYLKSSNDPELLEFARENIGAGVTQSRHMGVLRDLRVACTMRKRVAEKNTVAIQTAPVPSYLRPGTTVQLLAQSGDLKPGQARDAILKDLEKLPLDEVLADLGAAAANSANPKAQQQTRDLLDQFFSRQSPQTLQKHLQTGLVEVRASAARVAGTKGMHFEKELIEFLADVDPDLRQAAHEALVKLNPGIDFGPKKNAEGKERTEAVRQWRDWLAKQNGR